MPEIVSRDRRALLAASAAVLLPLAGLASAGSAPVQASGGAALPSMKRVRAGVLEIGYHEAGPAGGPPVVLLHGFPYSVDSYVEVVPQLAARGCRVLDGSADGVVPATDGKSSAAKFTGPRTHRVIPNAGHNLPEEAPAEFADAVWQLAASTS